MRFLSERQRTLSFYQTLPSFTQEWDMIASILEANPKIERLAWEDLTADGKGGRKKPTGAKGMAAEQVVRFAVVKMKERLSYRDLQARVADSICLREFCLAGFQDIPAFTTLQENIKRIHPRTWEAINRLIVGYAQAQGVEDGHRARIDTTGVKTNIHHPADSHQLWDCVRVITRILRRAETDIARLRGTSHGHTRAAKRLFYRIHNTRGQDNKKPLYKRLIGYTEKTVAYGRAVLAGLDARQCVSFDEMLLAAGYAGELNRYLPLAERVIDQSRRRVLLGQDVPAHEKVLSIFEEHTDVIKKGQREVLYGHKVLFSGGRSNLILDCVIERGNPSDASQFIPAIERQKQMFGQAPGQAAADAGFASAANARNAQAKGVKEIAFAAPRKKSGPDTGLDSKTRKQLCKWRAGIEGIISATKRAFGLGRCTWSGYESFKAYVQLAVRAFNLQTLARRLLA